jgi:hypothetical protein
MASTTTTFPVGTTILRSEVLFTLPVGTVLVDTKAKDSRVFRVIQSLTEGLHIATYAAHESTPGYVLTSGDTAIPAVIPVDMNLVIIFTP